MLALSLIGSCAAGTLPTTSMNCRTCQYATDWWNTARDQSIPATLRMLGLLAQPPEAVALEAIRSLDSHDMPRLLKVVGSHEASQHARFQHVMQSWPTNILDDPSTWTVVGPYPTEPWYTPPPLGTMRRVPVQVNHPNGCALCVIWVRNTSEGWQVISIVSGQ
jgi:hypothetical protein